MHRGRLRCGAGRRDEVPGAPGGAAPGSCGACVLSCSPRAPPNRIAHRTCGLRSSYCWQKEKNLAARRFSNRPISGLFSASQSVAGTCGAGGGSAGSGGGNGMPIATGRGYRISAADPQVPHHSSRRLRRRRSPPNTLIQTPQHDSRKACCVGRPLPPATAHAHTPHARTFCTCALFSTYDPSTALNSKYLVTSVCTSTHTRFPLACGMQRGRRTQVVAAGRGQLAAVGGWQAAGGGWRGGAGGRSEQRLLRLLREERASPLDLSWQRVARPAGQPRHPSPAQPSPAQPTLLSSFPPSP